MQFASVPDERVGIRADTVRHRFDQRQRDRGGEDRVHRVAAGGEHLQPRLRGERLGGGDHVLREQRLARPGVGVTPGKGSHCAVDILPAFRLSPVPTKY